MSTLKFPLVEVSTSYWGYEIVVKMLTDAGVDANAQGGDFGNGQNLKGDTSALYLVFDELRSAQASGPVSH